MKTKAVTGTQLRKMRDDLGMTSHALAEILGVNVSTLYRWESTDGEVRSDPLQRQILELLRSEMSGMLASSKQQLGKKITDTLVHRGPLVALSDLIVVLSS